MDKQFKVPELRQALAWLKNCDIDSTAVKSIKKKADILDALLVAIERLLPEQCDKCETEYTVGRESSPAIQCSGCQQGFHQECLEVLVGQADLPAFPGQLYWLCTHCAPRFSLMTVVGQDGKTEKPRSKRAVKEVVTEPLPAAQESETPENVTPVEQSTEEIVPPLPDCPLLVRGDCPHGMSGKHNGVCKYQHRARCSTYMKWGDRVGKGCKKVPCEKLHPLVCPRSLDLKCLEKNCDVKLHTKSAGQNQDGPGQIQDLAGPSHGHPQHCGAQPHLRENGQLGNGVQGKNCCNSIFQASTAKQDIDDQLQCGQAHVQRGCGHAGQHAAAGTDARSTTTPLWSFQTGCTPPDPAVHQLLEVWAGNIQREMERQSEIQKNMLASKVKEVCMFLGGQGAIRPSF